MSCIVIFIFIFLCIYENNAINVETNLGRIRGIKLQSRLGNEFYAFRGIRYAQPPVKDLRFKNPQPILPWKPDIFDATKDGPMCPQPHQNITNLFSEDCLRLNVYTKNLNGCRPVIVFIHHGGFYSMSGQSHIAGPELFMDRDVVLVTINYRIGSLGFLATGTIDAPGNAGLKDQTMSLRWIKSHIVRFGGDSTSVTLLGYSSGSMSIGLHMVSPMSKGLFHRAIAMNGSPLAHWKYEKDGLDLAKRQAELLNCTSDDIAKFMKCLRTRPMIDYINTQQDMFKIEWNPIINWKPVIEDSSVVSYGQERFLIENPFETIKGGNFHKVPIITGIAEYDQVITSYYTLFESPRRNWINENFDTYSPIALFYDSDTTRKKEITRAFRFKYLQNKPLRFPASLVPLGELLSDAVTGFAYYRFTNLMAPHIPNLYSYLFTYKGRYSHFQYPENQTFGAVHHDEMTYLFYTKDDTPLFSQTDPENFLIETMTRMLTEFAIKGDPNNPEDPFLKNITWKPYTKFTKPFLVFDDKIKLKYGGFFEKRYRFWDKLFPISK